MREGNIIHVVGESRDVEINAGPKLLDPSDRRSSNEAQG